MQVPNRQLGSYGYSLRNYAAVPLPPVPSNKSSSGRKSFTIDALLAESEDSIPGRAEDQQRYPPLLLVPPQPHARSAAPPYAFHPAALHGHAGYRSYCCWPPTCQPATCRASFYSQGTELQTNELNKKGSQTEGKKWNSEHSLCFLSTVPSMSRVHGSMNPFKAKGGKSKRMRTSFTSEQLSRLEKEFARQQYMVGSERFLLASALQLTEAQVSTHGRTHTHIHYLEHFGSVV